MMRLLLLAAVTAAMFALSACEKPQTAQTRKSDTKAWTGADNAFAASGWKAGDQTSWEEQMRLRAQAQNEYTRTGTTK
jgi:hypothetical protein